MMLNFALRFQLALTLCLRTQKVVFVTLRILRLFEILLLLLRGIYPVLVPSDLLLLSIA